MSKMIRVLSIDGGGIRGIIPAKILIRLEGLLQMYSGNNQARIGQYFDLIAGTSTGAILTSLYLCPEKQGSIHSKYKAEEILNFYIDNGHDIFHQNLFSRIGSVFGLLGAKYLPDNLENLLLEYLGDLRMEDLIKPCLIPAYDIVSGQAMFFNQMKAYRNDSLNYLVREIVRGSTAAPTYFPVAKIHDSYRSELALIDGGMFANNPALCAFIEACKFPSHPQEKDILLLSLGTGSKDISYEYEKAKKWGNLQWAIPVLDIYGSSASQTVHHQLTRLYQGNGRSDQYVRIDTELQKNHVTPDLDNVSGDNIKALLALGDQLVEEYDETLKAFARRLVIEQIGRPNDYYRLKFD